MRLIRTVPKDVVGGALFFVLGIAVAIQSTSYKIGSLNAMGPGYFPLALGVILATVGIAIAWKGYVSAPRVKGASPAPEWKAWVLIGVSIVAFILLARYLGLVVATFAIVFISALADRNNTWRAAVVLSLAMVVFAVVIFWWALQIQLPLFTWGGA
jgi:hypothetical protein